MLNGIGQNFLRMAKGNNLAVWGRSFFFEKKKRKERGHARGGSKGRRGL
jgi:hypothetical protein